VSPTAPAGPVQTPCLENGRGVAATEKEQAMRIHKCNCHYIPPHVLNRLASTGQEDLRAKIRTTALEAKTRRSKRAAMEISMSTFVGAAAAAAPKTADRRVFDCEHQWVLQVTEVRQEGDPATGDDDVDTVYEYLGDVRDYFQNDLNRNSYDNLGSEIIGNVNVGVDYMNAFWDGTQLAFGDGDGSIFSSFARSLDVIAHEFAHGVVQYTANLDYYSQSGALNESYSDVFGAVVTQRLLGQDAGTADWLCGNEIMGPTLFGEALRSLRSPGTAYDNTLMGGDPQPAHMNDYYAGPGDSQGVHINSGIINRAFFLVAYSIGTPKAARLWYHGLQNLWPTADFNDAADVLVDSARILVKIGDVPSGTTQTVRAAFKEVGLPV
jgi:Zn-dependent metalloprotease